MYGCKKKQKNNELFIVVPRSIRCSSSDYNRNINYFCIPELPLHIQIFPDYYLRGKITIWKLFFMNVFIRHLFENFTCFI